MFIVKACWSNGSGGLQSEPMCETLCEFDNLSNAKAASASLFDEWREKNPESDGWKSSAWLEIESQG